MKNKNFFARLFAPLLWLWRKNAQMWRAYKRLYSGAPWWKKLLLGTSSFVLFLLCYCLAVQFNFLGLFGQSPSLDEITNMRNATASEIYSSDGKRIGRLFNENRQPVPYDSIAPVFFDALIATEDERFYQHMGVDFFAIGAAVKDAIRGNARGASTLTQQLVKNMFKTRSYGTGLLGKIPGINMLIMKSKEMIIATELEFSCSKQEILEMYANTVDFAANSYGIKTAAKTYFNTTPSQLKPEEAAVLVGMLKATTAYNPKINAKRSKARRNVVLDNMVRLGKLSAGQAAELKAKEIHLNFTVESPLEGEALYFRQAVVAEIKRIAPHLDPYRDGLKITTTIDSRMQHHAEEATREHMKNLQRNFNAEWGNRAPWVDANGREIAGFVQEKLRQTDAYKIFTARYPDDPQKVNELLNTPHKLPVFNYEKGRKDSVMMSSVDSLRYMLRFMHTGFVALEPETGQVRAYVGDVDFNTWQHDNVMATHQPGSTFKLFAYATAIKQGWLPGDARLTDSYIDMEVIDKNGKRSRWRPKNANGNYSGSKLSLRTAFAQSVNTIAVKIGQEVGTKNIIETARDMGITTKLDDAPSLPLGVSDVSILELAGAYACVANQGEWVRPSLIIKIEDADGREVYNARKESRRVFSEIEAWRLQSLLAASVADAGGTSQSFASGAYAGQWYWARQIDLGGKTGTSNSNADAWFVGVSPKLVAATWVGGQYRQIHFRNGKQGQGSRAALPLVGLFFKKVLSDEALRSKYLARYSVPQGANVADISPRDEIINRPEEGDSLQSDSTQYDPDINEELYGKPATLDDEEDNVPNHMSNGANNNNTNENSNTNNTSSNTGSNHSNAAPNNKTPEQSKKKRTIEETLF